MIESASASISNVSNNKNILFFLPSLIGTVALTRCAYLLNEYYISPIFDLYGCRKTFNTKEELTRHSQIEHSGKYQE